MKRAKIRMRTFGARAAMAPTANMMAARSTTGRRPRRSESGPPAMAPVTAPTNKTDDHALQETRERRESFVMKSRAPEITRVVAEEQPPVAVIAAATLTNLR